jgi:phage host-nuclease inhibitor protein Gam
MNNDLLSEGKIMRTNRIKQIRPVIGSREAMESVVGEIATIKNRQRQLAASMDAQIQAVRERYEGDLAAEAEALDRKIEEVQAWSEANPAEFGAARSIETVHGTLGWRTGQPALKTLGGWTFERVLLALKASGATGYIRVKEEVNKQQLLAQRDALGAEKLRELGLRVVQEDSFFVEPKLTLVEA